MRFKIQYRNSITGIFCLGALAALLAVVILLGVKHRWFSKDYYYKAVLPSASGIVANMPLVYKGFTIGNIKSFYLDKESPLAADGAVHIVFTIYDTYNYLAVYGSLVEVVTSPIGALGNQFLFYPGKSTIPLNENDNIPAVHSKEGAALIAGGFAQVSQSGDSLTLLLTRVNNLLAVVDSSLKGDSATSLGRSFLYLEDTLSELQQTMSNLVILSSGLSGNNSTFVKNLESSVMSLSGILSNLDKTSSYLPEDMPQVAATLNELRQSIQSAEDVFTALTNNPLLKGGVPKHVQNNTTGAQLRNVEF